MGDVLDDTRRQIRLAASIMDLTEEMLGKDWMIWEIEKVRGRQETIVTIAHQKEDWFAAGKATSFGEALLQAIRSATERFLEERGDG